MKHTTAVLTFIIILSFSLCEKKTILNLFKSKISDAKNETKMISSILNRLDLEDVFQIMRNVCKTNQKVKDLCIELLVFNDSLVKKSLQEYKENANIIQSFFNVFNIPYDVTSLLNSSYVQDFTNLQSIVKNEIMNLKVDS